jgi:octaprenyl-diphosphate synthase
VPVIDQIKQPIATELANFESKFKQAMKSKVSLLDTITRYIVKRKGKQMRPMFVFLSAKMFTDTNESSYRAASLIELLHTATLVHDDVVDDSQYRRGFFSINALWKNKIAVLIGDYILSRGLLLALDNDEFQLLKIVSKAVREMSEGELLQIEKARKLDIDEAVYFDIIRQKTASLIASCCACGASSVNQPKEVIDKMHQIGELAGIAFQIKDDLLDYGDGSTIGKPTGIDIKEQKMTLPLIYALKQASFLEKRRIIGIVKNNNNNPRKVQKVVEFVNASGGLDYAKSKMEGYKQKALNLLNEFPETEARLALAQLIEYSIDRKK